jgi:metal-responsive CopG/Arc/MetJ family transcriptional regulator
MTSDRAMDDSVPVEVVFSEELLADIDQHAKRQGVSRSAVIVTALEE